MSDTKKILLVENDRFTRFMMQEIIKTLGVDVDIAIDGQQGCDQLNKNPDDYGVVLMDIHMPKMSGIDATRSIRQHSNDPPRNITIIAITADEQYHDATTITAHGMDGYMAKPITAGGLMKLVDQYCKAA